MAVVGEAHVIVRAITNRVRPDIQKAFEGLDGIGEDAGRNISDSFSKGLASGGSERGGLFSAKFRKEAEEARLKLDRLITTSFFLGPALTGLVGVVGALGGGLLTLGATASAVAAGGLVAIAGTLTAIGQAALTAKLAFAGVSKALSAGLKTQKASASNDKAVAAAKRRVADASLRLQRLQEEAKPELLAQLTQRQVDAEENLADAKISASRSERAYRDAQEASNKATERLNRTREEAKEKLQQLRFETEGAAISEKKARLEFIKARDALQRVQDLPPNSRARQEAELAFAEADLNLRKAIDRNKDLKKEEKAATAAGVEGSQAVKDATIAQRDARESVTDAQIDYAKSLKAVADAEKAASAAKNEATDDPTKSKAIRDINRQIADAVRDVSDARNDLADAEKGPGVDAFNDALSDLSPEAQRFVKYLLSIQDEFKKLRAAAGEELFPKLETAIQNLVDNLFPKLLPLLRDTGGVLGDIAIDFSNAITEGTNLANLETVWKNNDVLLRRLGKGATGFYGGMLALLAAAEPLIDKFGLWIQRLGETFEKTMKAKQATGELTEFFENINRISSGLGGAFKTAFSSLGDIIANVIAPGGSADLFVKYFDETFSKWKDFTSGGANNAGLTTFLNNLTINFTKVLDLIGNILGEAVKIGATPEFGIFIDKLNQAVDIFGGVGTELAKTLPALGDLVISFSEFTAILTESGAIKIFFNTLNGIFTVFNNFLKLPGVSTLIGLAAGAFAFLRAFRLVGKAIGFVGKAFAGNIFAYKNTITGLKRIQQNANFATYGLKTTGATAKIQRIALIGVGKAAGGIGNFFSNLFTNVSKWFTETLLPFFISLPGRFVKAVSGFWSWITDLLGGLFTSIGKWFTETLVPFLLSIPRTYIKLVSGFWGWIFDLLGTLFTNIGNWFSNTLLPWLKGRPQQFITNVSNFWTWITDLLSKAFTALSEYFTKTVIPFVTGLPKKFGDGAKAIWDFLSKGVSTAWSSVTGFFDKTVIGFIKDLPAKIARAAAGLWDGLKGGLQGVVDFIRNALNNIIKFINKAIDGVNKVNPFKKIPRIDEIGPIRLAKGGVIPATPGGTMALIGEAGRAERVEPLDANGLSRRDKAMIDYMSGGAGRGINIVVNPSAGMDERELANLVSRQLAYQMRRGAA